MKIVWQIIADVFFFCEFEISLYIILIIKFLKSILIDNILVVFIDKLV